MRTIELEIDKIKCLVTNEKSYRKMALKERSGNMVNYTDAANNHVSKYKDFMVNQNKEDLIVYSKFRGVSFVLRNLVFKLKQNIDEANNDWHYLFSLIERADEDYEIESTEDIDPVQYIKLIKTNCEDDMREDENLKVIASKQEAKRIGKSTAKFKYRIGDKYALRKKTINGDQMSDEIYEVKKFIYSIGNNPVNIVIMKQIHGKECKRKTLSPFDCQTFHIKYEAGLFVFSMNTSFFKLSDKQVVKLIEANKIESAKIVQKEIEDDVVISRYTELNDMIYKMKSEFDEMSGYNQASRDYLNGIISEERYNVIKNERDMELLQKIEIVKHNPDSYKKISYKRLY